MSLLPAQRDRQTASRRIIFSVFLLLLLFACSSCGYSNPYAKKEMQTVPAKTLYIAIWRNHTNELGLETEYYRLFNAWFKNSGRIEVIPAEEQADLKLNGEITAIDLPGLFYNAFDQAREINIKLTVRFTLLDNRNNAVLWQEKQYTVYEPFVLDPSAEKTRYNKEKALLAIGNEIAELIYLRTHEIAKAVLY